MHATAWSNGQPLPSGAGYGIRVSSQDRDRYFDRSWSQIRLDLGEAESVAVPLSTAFWDRCVELRSAQIGRWLLRHQLAPWPKGQPPALLLRHIGGNQFELRHPTKST